MGSTPDWDQVKLRDDPFIFKPADTFFRDIDNNPQESYFDVKRPQLVTYSESDNASSNEVCKYGRIFRLDGAKDSLLLIEFIRPKVWRIRFHYENDSPTDFTPYNTRTFVQDTGRKLIEVLDNVEHKKWRVDLIEDPQYLILQSVETIDHQEKPAVQLWIQRNPFKITAIRAVDAWQPTLQLPKPQNPLTSSNQLIKEIEGSKKAIIWETEDRGFKYAGNAAVLSVKKSITAKYIGFGEQGGRHFFKENTYMNYFNFDNMRYQNVYRRGPRDEREPLYHSEPYWVEVNGLPGFKSQVTTFIDNYSHVCVDLGKSKSDRMRVATRFNDFQCVVIAADDMEEGIKSYTSLIGRPKLKPRYVLGHHQGCYGYEHGSDLKEVVEQYRASGVPLDGLHVDVDVQNDYQTFTIGDRFMREKVQGGFRFKDPRDMFQWLRLQGVKCSTNITPYINSSPDPNYKTYNEGLEKGYFVEDKRDIDPAVQNPDDVRYQSYENGGRDGKNPFAINPTYERPDYSNKDNYVFRDAYNSGKPFHGGVFYGGGRGNPGVYPNLNNAEVRKWWGKQYKDLFDYGLEFVWQDMTSPCMAAQYGDMKSFPFRLLIDSDERKGEIKKSGTGERRKRRAIEIWALYSYNLHKATYHGLNKLKSRDSKRNFIIGRGSFAGSHRFAGLWTGDNASTWDFLDISVAQVLSLGLSGVTISGADVGGFEKNKDYEMFADPELLIRWYGAYSLLPWFRNHYIRKEQGKWFQEPYAYERHLREHPEAIPSGQWDLYRSVLPQCRYSIRLRYSLMQLLYDTMFENIVNGLPIARSMIITDGLDHSLYAENMKYVRGQYLVRNDLLVAPQLFAQKDRRSLYLPYPNGWYAMNLRPDDQLGVALSSKVDGGSKISYDCRISPEENQLPYAVPMYIREGAIIPKIEVRDFVPDKNNPTPDEKPNPITFHIYPGKDNVYQMFLDDGVSRDSAPKPADLATCLDHWHKEFDPKKIEAYSDPEAKSKYTQVTVAQNTSKFTDNNSNTTVTRTVQINSIMNGYPGELSQRIGTHYNVILWHEPSTSVSSVHTETSPSRYDAETNGQLKATIFKVPIEHANTLGGVKLELTHAL